MQEVPAAERSKSVAHYPQGLCPDAQAPEMTFFLSFFSTSYFNAAEKLASREGGLRVVAGSYSYMRVGKHLDVHEYCTFLRPKSLRGMQATRKPGGTEVLQ